jgi:hypothetical protein
MSKPSESDIPVGRRRLWSCAFDGCPETSEQPARDGWVGVAAFPGLADGRYCKAHGDAIRALEDAGGFDDLDSDEEDER